MTGTDDGLLGHLVSAHGRTAADLAGLRPADVHSFEHVEQALGLIELDHTHEDQPSATRTPTANPAASSQSSVGARVSTRANGVMTRRSLRP
jgi:hypothetical protein